MPLKSGCNSTAHPDEKYEFGQRIVGIPKLTRWNTFTNEGRAKRFINPLPIHQSAADSPIRYWSLGIPIGPRVGGTLKRGTVVIKAFPTVESRDNMAGKLHEDSTTKTPLVKVEPGVLDHSSELFLSMTHYQYLG